MRARTPRPAALPARPPARLLALQQAGQRRPQRGPAPPHPGPPTRQPAAPNSAPPCCTAPHGTAVLQDKGYLWIEIPLSDIFKLDVSEMKSIDDYTKLLSKKGRWNFKDRQKK